MADTTTIDSDLTERDLKEVETQRFSFTKKLGSKPSPDEYNSLLDDFKSYLDSSTSGKGVTRHNLEGESIRFRHLEDNPVRIKFKDCSELIWKALPGRLTRTGWDPPPGVPYPTERWDLFSNSATRFGEHATNGVYHDLMIKHRFSASEPDSTNLAQFSFWYYPYQLHQQIEVCPAVLTLGTVASGRYHWHPLYQYKRKLGIGVGFYGPWEALPYDVDRGDGIVHPYANILSGTVDPSSLKASVTRPGTVAHGGPVICTVTLPAKGITLGAHNKHYDNESIPEHTVDLSDIIGFGMMVKIYGSAENDYMESRCSVYDRLFMNLVTRSGV